MAALSRKGDKNSAGGELLRGAASVTCDGIPVALHVSRVSPHAPYGKPHPPHASSVTTSASPTVFCEGLPVVRVGSSTSCGHKIVGGSSGVNVP